MKGVFVFNQLNDLLFMSADQQLEFYINSQAYKAKLITKDQIHHEVDTNVLIQLFSPLVASQRFMTGGIDNPYHTVKCQNDLIFAFRQFNNQMMMAIGQTSDTEEFLHRKLLVLNRLLEFLFGPVVDEVHTSDFHQRNRNWDLISALLENWTFLYHTEQCFLVEAVERLTVNQSLSARCLSLLESVLTTMTKTGGDKGMSHGLLLVQCKLLSLYSSRSAFDLGSADLLLLILLSNTVYPHSPDDLNPSPRSMSSGSDRSTSGRSRSSSTDQPSKNVDHGSFFSSVKLSSPDDANSFSTTSCKVSSTLHSSSEESSEKSSQSNVIKFEESSYQEWTMLDDKSGISWAKNVPPSLNEDKRTHSNKLTLSLNESVKPVIPIQQGIVNSDNIRTFTVFVQTPHCKYTPVTLQLLRVLPGITLVTLSEIPKTSHASLIVETISHVTAIENLEEGSSGVNSLIVTMETTLKKFNDIQKKYKGSTYVDKLVKEIRRTWEAAKAVLVKSITSSGVSMQDSRAQIRLENILTSLAQTLRDLFRVLFIIPRKLSAQDHQRTQQALQIAHKRAVQQLADYQQYLAIKALRNVVITSYLEEFPGLVHFIYIDRSSHYMTAPSIVSVEKGAKDGTEGVRDTVWREVSHVYRRLASGYTSVTARDNHFYISYCLWHEDAMGNPLTAQQIFRGNSEVLPGILAGDFYKKLRDTCFPPQSPQPSVCCYELLCVHVGLVPTQYMLSHCRKLAAMLWESKAGPVI